MTGEGGADSLSVIENFLAITVSRLPFTILKTRKSS